MEDAITTERERYAYAECALSGVRFVSVATHQVAVGEDGYMIASMTRDGVFYMWEDEGEVITPVSEPVLEDAMMYANLHDLFVPLKP